MSQEEYKNAPESDIKAPESDAGAVAGLPGLVHAAVGADGKARIYKNEEDAEAARQEREAVLGYNLQIEAMKKAASSHRLETDEERRKRERQEKSRKIIGAVSDGLSALTNLFFTTQYAPNAYNPEHSQLRKANESIARAKAERDADAERYYNYIIRLGDTQNAKAKTLRDMAAQHEARKQAREKAARDAEEHGWKAALQPDVLREQKGKADRAESQAASAQVEAEYAPQMAEAKLATETAHKESYEASAANSYASAEEHRQNSVYGTFDGKVYTNKRDYDKAVFEAAREYNKRHPMTVKKTRQVKGEDGKYVDQEYEEAVDVVPTSWAKQTAYGHEWEFYDASNVAATLEPLLRRERETDNRPPSRRGK